MQSASPLASSSSSSSTTSSSSNSPDSLLRRRGMPEKELLLTTTDLTPSDSPKGAVPRKRYELPPLYRWFRGGYFSESDKKKIEEYFRHCHDDDFNDGVDDATATALFPSLKRGAPMGLCYMPMGAPQQPEDEEKGDDDEQEDEEKGDDEQEDEQKGDDEQEESCCDRRPYKKRRHVMDNVCAVSDSNNNIQPDDQALPSAFGG